MKQFKQIIAPRIDWPNDPGLESAVNRALEDIARDANNAIRSLVRLIPQELPLWAEGEEVTLQCNKIFHDNATELAVRHHLGVKPTRYIVLKETVNDLTIPLWGSHFHNVMPTESTWTDKYAYFYASPDAIGGDTTFKILLLP